MSRWNDCLWNDDQRTGWETSVSALLLAAQLLQAHLGANQFGAFLEGDLVGAPGGPVVGSIVSVCSYLEVSSDRKHQSLMFFPNTRVFFSFNSLKTVPLFSCSPCFPMRCHQSLPWIPIFLIFLLSQRHFQAFLCFSHFHWFDFIITRRISLQNYSIWDG